MATSTKTDRLAKRFLPYEAQAQTQGALRYGAQEAALKGIFDDTTQQYQRQSTAQDAASRSLLGTLATGSTNLNQAYTDAGLTPELRAQIANSPDGQRIAAALAREQGNIQQQKFGAQAGGQYIQQRLADDYRGDVNKINSQGTAMATERGLYESSLLDQLIGDDRSRRHDANAAAAKQTFDAEQALQSQNAAQGNALIGQGLLPGADGSLTPLPGGKADPNAPANKPKRTTGPGTASPDAQRSAGTSFQKAAQFAKAIKDAADAKAAKEGKTVTPGDVRDSISNILTNGKPAQQGKVVYEVVPALDNYGKPIPGKTKRQPKLDAQGQQVTTATRPAVPAFDAPIAAAATEQALYGYVTTKTVQALQKLGFSVNQIPGLKTENQARAARPKDSRDYARPGTAGSRAQQPG